MFERKRMAWDDGIVKQWWEKSRIVFNRFVSPVGETTIYCFEQCRA